MATLAEKPLTAEEHLAALRLSNEPGREIAQSLKYWTWLEGKTPPPNSAYKLLKTESEHGKRKALNWSWWRQSNDMSRFVIGVGVVGSAGLAYWIWAKDYERRHGIADGETSIIPREPVTAFRPPAQQPAAPTPQATKPAQ